MFSFLKSKKTTETTSVDQAPDPAADVVEAGDPPASQGWLTRLGQSLKKTRQNLTSGLSNVILGKKQIDAELFEELETRLLLADVGIEVTNKILNELTQQVARKELDDPQRLLINLKKYLIELLTPYSEPLVLNDKQPFVVLMVGVNGAGKTTSIAKMAHFYQQQGKKILLAAGDTFRAAAIEQLQVWGERNQVPVIAQSRGADSASVIFDALQAAKARRCDLMIADTAGRLHTQANLMAELSKIKRVMHKLDETAPHEAMLVIDAGMGQNALRQAEQFNQALHLTGITLTKLDGTAKGGIVFAIADKMKLPIRFIGVGEDLDDLKPFNAVEFVDALFAED